MEKLCTKIHLTALAIFMLCMFFVWASVSSGDHLGFAVAVIGAIITVVGMVVKHLAFAV